MKIRVHFTPSELDASSLQDATVVGIDVVRATTVIVEAIAHGARGVLPTASAEEAVKLAASLGREDTLLCGERKGLMVEGFDLGNSPGEFVPDVVAGKRLVMSTTSGTVALAGAFEARRLVACALTNLQAVAEAVRGEKHLVVLCAGSQGRFALEDALCAGHLLERLGVGADADAELDDASQAALALADSVPLGPGAEWLGRTAAARGLGEIGLVADLEICAHVDRHEIVPELVDQTLVRGGERPRGDA